MRDIEYIEYADKRLLYQTQWSQQFRKFLYGKLPEERPLSILEVGSGTGAVVRRITEEIPDRIFNIVGVDLNCEVTKYASRITAGSFFEGNGEFLPFKRDCFDLVYCHYLLLLVPDPVNILKEMRRVLCPGGICAAMAEPCYSDMTAEPESLRKLAERQREHLISEGIDPAIGRNLMDHFQQAGFTQIESTEYQQCEQTEEYLTTEIRQMAEDAGTEMYMLKDGEKAYYNVPTYYAFAVK